MRNRTIYQSEAVYVSESPATGESGGEVKQLYRVQTVNDDFSIKRTDINQLGSLAAIGREIIEAPTVNFGLSYLLSNVLNESNLGLVVDGSCSTISGLLSKASDEKNYYNLIVPEGQDAVGYDSEVGCAVVGIGNGFLSSYSAEAKVGGLPSVTIGVQALNVVGILGRSGIIPAVNPVDGKRITGYSFDIPTAESGVTGQVTALRPGDITVSLDSTLGKVGIGVDIDDAKIQSFQLSFDLNREPLQKLGSRFAFSREIQFPVTVNASVEAQLGDLTSGDLAEILCDDAEYTIEVQMRKPSCTGVGELAVGYTLKGAKLDSQNSSSSIGPSKTVSLKFSAQLGGPQDLAKGLFISGSLT